MMSNKYNLEISPECFQRSMKRIINLVYKLLPMREEGQDWKPLLKNLNEELSGMSRLIVDLQPEIFRIVCKMEGLFTLVEETDMALYRKTIFECISLLSKLEIKE